MKRFILMIVAMLALVVGLASATPARATTATLSDGSTYVDPSTVPVSSSTDITDTNNVSVPLGTSSGGISPDISIGGGYCLVGIDPIAQFSVSPKYYQGKVGDECFSDEPVYIRQTVCLQRGYHWDSFWSNENCASKSGWDTLNQSLTHWCDYTTVAYDWRVHLIVSFETFSGTVSRAIASTYSTGKCF